MKIDRCALTNFRNHSSSTTEFGAGINVLYGLNGTGKTSVLEAISVLAFSKSFLPVGDAEITRFGTDGYTVRADCTTDVGAPYWVCVNTSGAPRKQISSSLGSSLNPKDIIGEIPVVILTPDLKSISFGSPADRRAFIDRLLSQCSKRYLEELSSLRRILRQRNSVLSGSPGFLDKAQLEAWTEQLIETSAEIIWRRAAFVSEFKNYFGDSYATISLQREAVSLRYLPDPIKDFHSYHTLSKNEIADLIRVHSTQCLADELRRGITLWGPQKDELEISINGSIARDSASQGQHKSILIAIKKAEFDFLKNARGETPILLLDDIFSELDNQRSSHVFETIISNSHQTFITTTELERIKGVGSLLPQVKIFRCQDGELYAEQS